MKENKFQRAYNLKLIADEFNNLSDYEKYVKTHKEYLDDIYNQCLESAKRGRYSLGIFTTFRYNDPDKEHLKKYFENLYYKVTLEEPTRNPGNDYINIPYRQYILMLDWHN